MLPLRDISFLPRPANGLVQPLPPLITLVASPYLTGSYGVDGTSQQIANPPLPQISKTLTLVHAYTPLYNRGTVKLTRRNFLNAVQNAILACGLAPLLMGSTKPREVRLRKGDVVTKTIFQNGETVIAEPGALVFNCLFKNGSTAVCLPGNSFGPPFQRCTFMGSSEGMIVA